MRTSSFHQDPATLSRRERSVHYREQAVQYKCLADGETRPFVREGLLDLAQQCDDIAKKLAASAGSQPTH